jgi:hypothetical protein
MERQFHNESIHQPSLFTCVNPPPDKETFTGEKPLEEVPHPNEYYIALDRLLEAMEDLLHGDYPLSDKLHRRLSNPALEMLIFDEMNKSLKLVQEQMKTP